MYQYIVCSQNIIVNLRKKSNFDDNSTKLKAQNYA